MKKILTVSIMAVMAVTAANAEIASKAYVDQNIGTISTYGGATNVATAIANALTAANVSEALQSVTANGAAGVVTNIAKDGTAVIMTKAKVTGADIADDAGIAATQLADGVQTTLTNAAADHTKLGDTDAADFTKLHAVTASATELNQLTGKTLGDIVTHNASEFETAGTAAGLVGTLPAGSNNVVEYVDSVKSTAEGALTANSALNGANITAGTVPETALNTATQTKIDGAVQDVAEGATNGTVAVDGTDVPVHGLGDLAYKSTVVSADITDGTIDSADIKDGAVILAKLGGTLPTECTGANPTHECVLKSTASGLGWEKIQRSTTGE